VATKRLVTLAVCAVMTLGACGGGAAPATAGAASTPETTETSEPQDATAAAATAAPANGSALDACSLLTPAEVKQVTGADTTAEVETTSGWADWVAGQCWWNNADMTVRFSADYGTPASIAKSSSPTAQEQLDLSKLAYKAFGDVEEIPGLGDGAIFGAGMVTAIKNGSMLQLAGLGLDKQKAIDLAKLALARL
jgi:hypothetical protein